MMPEKLKIKPRAPSQLAEITVLFNPNSYTVEKTVNWGGLRGSKDGGQTQSKLNAPSLSFGGGASRQLTLELFFDVTESRDPRADVRVETNKLVALTRIMRDKQNPRPPVCEVTWGRAPTDSDFPFVGVVSHLTQKFTLFRATGEPVRATLNVTFLEFIEPQKDRRKTDPELTTHVVKRGDTLSGIAARLYRNPALWRVIAEANRIDDPRRQPPGRVLTIPKIERTKD